MSKHTGIPIGVDDTDHIAFFCPKCGHVLRVKNVVNGQAGTPPADIRDTHIYLTCNACKFTGWRKFYWNEDGKYCTHRTDGDAAKRPELTDVEGAPISRAEVIEGLRVTYNSLLEKEREEDPTLRGYPDMERILDYIEAHGLEPRP